MEGISSKLNDGKEDDQIEQITKNLVKLWCGSYTKFVIQTEKSFHEKLSVAVMKQVKAIFKYLNKVHIERLCSIIYVFDHKEEEKDSQQMHKRISVFTSRRRSKLKSLKYIHSFAKTARRSRDENNSGVLEQEEVLKLERSYSNQPKEFQSLDKLKMKSKFCSQQSKLPAIKFNLDSKFQSLFRSFQNNRDLLKSIFLHIDRSMERVKQNYTMVQDKWAIHMLEQIGNINEPLNPIQSEDSVNFEYILPKKMQKKRNKRIRRRKNRKANKAMKSKDSKIVNKWVETPRYMNNCASISSIKLDFGHV